MTMIREIPILRVPFDPGDKAFLHQAWDEILQNGNLTMGKYTEDFERRFAELCGVKYATATSSGTSALEVILRAVGVEGGSVVVPTNTFLATALAVIHSGAKVIFGDSNPDDLCLDPKDVERKLRPDTRAILTVHVGGLMSVRLEELLALADKRGIPLLEDCAHAHGCGWKGKKAGSIGKAGAFSFFPTKVLTCGEGGMVTTNDEGLYRQVMMIRNHGKNPAMRNQISELGYNWRLSELTAAMGVQQVKKAAEIIERRIAIARQYDAELKGWDAVEIVRPPAGTTSSYYKYIVYLKDIPRQSLKEVLKKEYKISLTGEVYADLCHDQPLFQKQPQLAYHLDDAFPGARKIADGHACLPLYPDLTSDEIRYVVESLKRSVESLRTLKTAT
jgi:perosamine synthetase